VKLVLGCCHDTHGGPDRALAIQEVDAVSKAVSLVCRDCYDSIRTEQFHHHWRLVIGNPPKILKVMQ